MDHVNHRLTRELVYNVNAVPLNTALYCGCIPVWWSILSHRSSSLLSSYAVYLVLSGATAFFFTVFGTLSAVYRVQTAGLSPL